MFLKFGFFIKWHIKFRGLFNAKVFFDEEKQWHYLTHSQKWG